MSLKNRIWSGSPSGILDACIDQWFVIGLVVYSFIRVIVIRLDAIPESTIQRFSESTINEHLFPRSWSIRWSRPSPRELIYLHYNPRVETRDLPPIALAAGGLQDGRAPGACGYVTRSDTGTFAKHPNIPNQLIF